MRKIFNFIMNVVYTTFILASMMLVGTRLAGLWSGFVVDGESMNTTFKSGQCIVTVKAFNIKAGDIVVVDNANNFLKNNGSNAKRIVKRIVAVPGDTIECIDGAIYVNDIAYIKDGSDLKSSYKKDYKLTLGKDEYFIIGDNFNNSFDSRLYENKAIPKENIEYKVVFY